MMRKCFVLAICVLALASCKKNHDTDTQNNISCENTTYYAPDSLISLLTKYTSTSTTIVKIDHGVQTTVAAASGYEFWGPSLSPDKQRFICFRSTTGDAVKVNDYANAELWMFNIDGSNGHKILSRTGHGWMAMGMADWAFDNFHIVLAAQQPEPSDGGNPHWNIFLADTTGLSVTQMNSRVSDFSHPHFANGTMAYVTYSALPVGVMNGNTTLKEIFYTGVDAAHHFTTENRITNDDQYDYSPSFSPGNNKIAFCKTTSHNAGTANTLHAYDVSTGNTSVIISDNTINDMPFWCPTNNFIYYVNSLSSHCFKNCRRINEMGLNKSDVFRTTNAHYYDIYTR